MTFRRLVAVCLAIVVAGSGFMLAVLPWYERVVDEAGTFPDSGLECDPPLVGAFRDDPAAPGGWFVYAPGTNVVPAVSAPGRCEAESRRRLSWGAAALAVGTGAAVAARPRGHEPR